MSASYANWKTMITDSITLSRVYDLSPEHFSRREAGLMKDGLYEVEAGLMKQFLVNQKLD